MFRIIVGLLQMLWPFIKESALQDGTLKDFIRRNKTSCVWMTFQIIMFLTVLWMADIVQSARYQANAIEDKYAVLKNDHQHLKERLQEAKNTAAAEKARADQLQAAHPGVAYVPSLNQPAVNAGGCGHFIPPSNLPMPPFQLPTPDDLKDPRLTIAKLTSYITQVRTHSRTAGQNWENAYGTYLNSCAVGQSP